ncbi:MAG: nitrous oxide reductase family maturation protein NosD [Sphingobacteriales bacterium]|nr:nitrous oxide reductase family maturation protein NosD [Sphingobacteriales bacterium]
MKVFFTILCSAWVLFSSGTSIIVGPGSPVRSLKKAIELAKEKDTIRLQAGLYKEGTLILTKSLTLIGDNNPVLDGEKKYEILLISGKNITVQGIVFRNSGYSAMNDYAAIKLVDCSRVTLDRNTILDAYFAIHVSNSVHCIIRNNRISGVPTSEQLTGNGIHLWKSDHALIENNQVQGHRDGIYFEFVTASTISNNRSEKNIRYGLHFMFSNDDTYRNNIFRDNGAGVAVMYSKKVRMEKNHFEENWGASAYGILLKDITDSYIGQNSFLKNTVGIHMEGSSRIEICQNQFRNNGWALKVQASCDDNVFHHNNFTGNSFDVGTNGTLVLNKFENNYWDNYEGYDMNKDGIGDIPYHPVSMYSMIVEQNPTTLMLFRSFMVSLLDKAEKAIPSLTPENLFDNKPMMKKLPL